MANREDPLQGSWYIPPPNPAKRTRTGRSASSSGAKTQAEAPSFSLDTDYGEGLGFSGGDVSENAPVYQPEPQQASSVVYGTAPTQGLMGSRPAAPVNTQPASAPVWQEMPSAEPAVPVMSAQQYMNTRAPETARTYPTQYTGSGGSKDKKPKKKRHIGLILALLLLLALGVAAGIGYSRFSRTKAAVAPYENVFANGVSVDGIDLSGKTYDEGSRLVQEQISRKQDGWYVRLYDASGNSVTITAPMLGISFDPSAALQQAWSVARGVAEKPSSLIPDSLWEPFGRLQVLQANAGGSREFSSARQNADTSQVDTILSTLEARLYRAPSDAVLLSFNPDDSSNPFSYQDEVYGQYLDTTQIRESILSMVQNLESGDLLLETQFIAPQVTRADLEKTVELRFRAVTPIAYHTSHSTEERTGNIRLAFSRINGTILKDGEKLSFNKKVGKRSLKNGFQEAIEYVYGQEQLGIGGGVCQASTTLYLAAVQSGLKINKRTPHSMAVSYTDLGKDATVSDTKGREIDFVFTNNSGSDIYIAAHVINSSTSKKNLLCEVRIYGMSLGNIRYELQTETVETIPKPDPVTKKDTNAEYVTYSDQTKTVANGREGYVVKSYLVTYENGYVTDRKEMYTDTYPAKADTIYVGTLER